MGKPFVPLAEEAFESREDHLREALLDAQFDLADSKRAAVLILLNGPDGSGKGEVLNRLHHWLDPRGIATLAFDLDGKEETRRPKGWRYWREMPARGRIGVMLGSWYHLVLRYRVTRALKRGDFADALERINRTETMLAADGVKIVKIWLDLTADEAARRYHEKRTGPDGPARPLVREWGQIDTKKERRRLLETAEEIFDAPTAPEAPWYRVTAIDPLARDLKVGEIVLGALQAANAPVRKRRHNPPAQPRRITRGRAQLAALDLTQHLAKSAYKERLGAAQKRLYDLTRGKAFAERALVCVFEGNDAAGKGGAIRRMRAALDPMQSEVHPIAAPSDASLERPYLWRFWVRVPERGHTVIFDRSWYGRVLVERVEGFAAPADWRRAYSEINDFEHILNDDGYIVHKFWLAIDAEEQLARFNARKRVPHKRFKITDEDWRNREKWDLYAAAVEDMLAKTATPAAPWTVVEANDKRFARVKVLETLVRRLEEEL